MNKTDKIILQNKKDVSSLSNFDKIVQKEINFNLFINFEQQTFEGSVEISFDVLDSLEKSIVLDCKKLDIQSIYLLNNENKSIAKELEFIIHNDHPSRESLGTPLEINISDINDSNITILINYKTMGGDGIQWLDKDQTATKKKPYVFTQGEFILSRTLFPCQDTPSVKVHFKKVVVICEEGISVVFGGKQISKENINSYVLKSNNKTYENCVKYTFTQDIKVCTYLFAIIAGEIAFKKISDNFGIYAEIPILDKAFEEFKDCEIFIKKAEEYLDFPYVWGDYNILILPDIFLFNGKENPNLTCLSPGLIQGDRSCIDTEIHEIMHSWTGNLVSPKNWNNFWMNEGFTHFLTRKVESMCLGKEHALLHAEVGFNELVASVNSFEKGDLFTALYPDLKDQDPDDGFSRVPYEKGFNLLYYIESLLGEINFRDILRLYIKKFAYKSVEFNDFKTLLESEVKARGLENKFNINGEKFDWQYWVYTPGNIDTQRFNISFETNESKKAKELFKKIAINDTKDANQINCFIKTYESLAHYAKIIFINEFFNNKEKTSKTCFNTFKLIVNSNNKNLHPNIGSIYYRIAFSFKDEDSIKIVDNFLQNNRRMAIIRPVYVYLYKFKKDTCLDIFNKNKHLYFAVTAKNIVSDFDKIDKGLI